MNYPGMHYSHDSKAIKSPLQSKSRHQVQNIDSQGKTTETKHQEKQTTNQVVPAVDSKTLSYIAKQFSCLYKLTSLTTNPHQHDANSNHLKHHMKTRQIPTTKMKNYHRCKTIIKPFKTTVKPLQKTKKSFKIIPKTKKHANKTGGGGENKKKTFKKCYKTVL